AGTGLIEGQDFGFDPPEYVNSFCVAPQGSTGLLELGDMPSATVAGNGVHAYPDRVLPGLGTVDVMVEAAGGAHAASLNALDGDHQQSWLNQSLPASGAAIYLEAYSSGTLTVSYRFDQPTGNVDLLLLDIDDEDRVTLAAVDALGRPVSDFRGWRYRAGDMSVWANPDPVAEAPRWDAGSATVTSMDDGNDNRSFAILTPDVLLSELKVTFRAPAVTGRHVYTTLHSTLDGRDGETGCTTGSISGRLYVDTNGNDRMDAVGERPVGGAAVALYDQRGSATDGRDDRLVATTVAQPDGRYAFQNVGTGLTYRIEVAAGDAAIPAGYLPGTPNPLTDVHVSADTDTGGQDFGFDPPVGSVAGIAVAGEFRFDDCDGSGSWNLDASGYGNSVTGTPSVVVSDFKSYGCTAMRNSSGNLEVPHQSGYELDQGAVSILLYDNQDIWNGSRLLEKGSTAAQALMLNVNQAGSPTRGTISARLNGNTISTGETYFTVRQDGSVDDGQWTHVLLSFGPGGMKLYVNGALKGSNPYTGGIGSVAGNFRLPSLNGYFDEFYIFSEQPDDEAANAIYRNLLNNRNLDGSLRTCACERGENYCVVPDGQTGNLETTDIPATPVSGSGGFSYPAQVLPGLGRVDVTVDQTGGMHHLSDTAIDTAVKQQSWLNENLPASGSALYLEPASGSVTRVTYDFDQPTGNVDLLLLDIDAEDSVTISALDGAGNPVSRFTGWRYRAGDMSVWQSPDAAPPSWNPASATVSSTDTGDNHRSFALLTPDTLVTRIVIRFASPAAGRNVYATLHSTERGRHGNDACLGIQKDRSDAPASYGEATHDIPDSATYYLGSRLPDADSVSLMQAGAMGDDTSGFDDDEGVSIPWLGRSTTVAIKARVNGTGGYLQGWIDWNGNGSFADPGEQVAMDLQDNDGNGRISIPVMVPATATRAETYARFRWSSRAGLNVTDPAPDGEVEDYVVRVQAFCPAPVQLDWSNVTWTPGNKNNAYWVAGKTISLTVSDPAGALVTTPYPAPGNGVYYQGDEAAPSNTLMVAGKLPVMGTSNHLETEIRVGVSGIGVDGLHFRLFDADGEVDKFDRQEKYVITGYFRNRVVLPVLTGSSAHIINGNTVLGDYPTRPAGGNSDESVLHVAFPQTVDRVVIDFSINNGALITDSEPGFGIHNLAFCGVGPFSDYSDAPASYGRAEHLLSDPGFFLGQGAPDADTQALDSMDALGDDNNAVDDEDGVSIGRLIAGESAWINVRTAGSGGYLQAWFDWNADGDFADASERVATNLSASASTGDIGFNVRVPLDAVPGTTYSRFRWSRDVSLSPSAPASDGEVEDYAVVIHPTAGPVVEGSCSVDGGQDVLFVVDNSGSISEAEYAAFQNSMLQVGSRLLADSPASRVAVAHYAGSMPYQQQMVYIERDFSAAPMTTPVRQFATGGVFDSSARSDYLAVALQFLRFALDGDPDTTHDQLVGPIHELDRSGARPLQIIVFSDAYANSGSSVTLDLDNMAYEPGDGSNYAVFNLLKRQGVTFSVVFIQDSSDAREEFAAIASVGGAYTGEVADNIADPEVNQATPRRLFIKGSGFALTGVEVEQIVTTAQENCISADYSDAPASYGSAFHTGDDSLYLGSIAPDRELEARTGPAADGDDTSGVDDEDGVQVPLLTAGSSVTVPVAVTGAGYLQAWVDWNRDGDFQDAGEQVAQDLQDNAAGDTDSRTGWISFEVGVPAG
ncbi:MAG TPA: GEVED domain-containing protein, partial [Thiolinea sp.]|nr:GEVED domain-containing protein [Thiolinea sp.]